MNNNKVAAVVGGFFSLIFGGIIINTLLGEADNSSATQLLTFGLSAAGIFGIVRLVLFILKRLVS